MQRLLRLLGRFDVFFLGVHCPLEELERRERERRDRRIGEARADYETTHEFGIYDFEVDSTVPGDRNVEAVIAAWKARQRPSAFERMAQGAQAR
jgi:chloramphenicol 3-O phosphotransferase